MPTSRAARSPVALISTIGGKPQVATFALDALLAAGVRVSRLHVVHLSAANVRVKRAIDTLRKDIATHYGKAGISFESHPVKPVRSVAAPSGYPVYGPPIERIDDPAAADAIWMTVHGLIARLKGDGCAAHVCVTGGPRLIGLQTLSAASLMLGGGDECWHIYTPDDLREKAGEGAILHAPAGQVRLVRVPLLPLGGLAPILRRLAFATPQDVISAGQRQLSDEHKFRCRRVLAGLTAREQDALRAFAEGARTNAEAAKKLGVRISTLSTYTSKIYDLCREAWGEDPQARLTHHDLRERFAGLPAEEWG
ncbi:MAG: CRISPR-associated ring nuclease [Thermoflexales bacterium]